MVRSRIRTRISTRNAGSGFEKLDPRALLAADIAVMDNPVESVADTDKSALISSEAHVVKSVGDVDVGKVSPELVANPVSPAIQAIDELFGKIAAEDLTAIDDVRGFDDLVESAEGIGAFVPDAGEAAVIELPDLENPEGWGAGDWNGTPTAKGASSLVRVSMGPQDHLGGIASQDGKTEPDREVAGSRETSEDGRFVSWRNEDGTEVTVRDRSGEHSRLFGDIESGRQIRVESPDGTITYITDYQMVGGGDVFGTEVLTKSGRQIVVHDSRGLGEEESVDPDAEAPGVVLPHQRVPDLNPAVGLTTPDRSQPEATPTSGTPGKQIDPGLSIVVNPASSAQQAREVSHDRAAHWKEALLERAGGIVNPK